MEVDVMQLAFLIWSKATLFFDQSLLWLSVKFFLFVYVAVLFVNIVLLLVLRGFSSDLKVALYGAERPIISKSQLIKRWELILGRLESGNPSQYKVAVLEADTLADEILDGMGFRGVTMAEKLGAIHGGQLETKTVLIEAHEARNRIIHDPQFSLSHEEAKKSLESFEKFFMEVELF